MHEYQATRMGTLSNPYKLVKPGEKFTSEKKLKGRWFEEVTGGKKVKPKKELPTVANTVEVEAPKEAQVFSDTASESYKENMKNVEKNEKTIDAKAKKSKGTGNQDIT